MPIITNRQGQPKFLIYCLLFLLLVLPSLVPWRYEPYINFYTDMIVGMLSSLLAAYLFSQGNKVKLSIIAFCLLAFALYLPLQSLLVSSPYLGNSLYISSFFILMAWLSIAIFNVPKQIFEYINFSLLWSIVILAVVQLSLYIMQLAITDDSLRNQLGWLLFSGEGGQGGQRNNFSHIMMWGLLATIILERKQRLNSIMMWVLVFCYVIAMAHTGSRTVLLYVVGLSIITIYQLFIVKDKDTKVFSRNMLIALALTLLAQFILPIIINEFNTSINNNLAAKLAGSSGFLARWLEWQKAWLAFLDVPLFGHGWGTYGFQSFWLHDQVAILGMPREDNYFSHSHNILLQLLAEIGLLGTLIIITPVLYILLKAIFKYTSNVMLFGLAMICVTSLIHSMVELPLWSSSFLVVFLLVLSLIVRLISDYNRVESRDLNVSKELIKYEKSKWSNICLTFSVISMLSVLAIFMDHERQVRKALTLGIDIVEAQKIAIGLQGKYIPYYMKYGDWLETFRFNPNEEDLQQIKKSDELLIANMQYYPYYTYITTHIIYLHKMGRKDEAKVWLDKLILYYPRMLPSLIRLTQDYPEDLGYLQQDIVEKCNEVLAVQMYEIGPKNCLIPLVTLITN